MTNPQVFKKNPGKFARLWRLVLSGLDPRAYAHALKIVNFYNYAHVQERRHMTIGAAPRISPTVTFANGCNITLGDRVRIGAHCALWAGPGQGRIILGNDCLLGPNILMSAANYHINHGAPVTAQPMKESDIVIGNDVWFGASVIVLPGAVIGSGAVIAAGSVIKGDIPPFSIVSGPEAQIVGQRRIAQNGHDQ